MSILRRVGSAIEGQVGDIPAYDAVPRPATFRGPGHEEPRPRHLGPGFEFRPLLGVRVKSPWDGVPGAVSSRPLHNGHRRPPAEDDDGAGARNAAARS